MNDNVRAKERISFQQAQQNVPLASVKSTRLEFLQELNKFGQLGSQVGDDRPMSLAVFSPDSTTLATAGWSGVIRLWAIPECEELCDLRCK